MSKFTYINNIHIYYDINQSLVADLTYRDGATEHIVWTDTDQRKAFQPYIDSQTIYHDDRSLNQDNDSIYDPLTILETLTNNHARLTSTFHDEFEAYIEALSDMLFLPNGYKLQVIKINDKIQTLKEDLT